MLSFSTFCMLLLFISTLVHDAGGQSYSDLEAMEVDCPRYDKCTRRSNNLSYLERSCECDSECHKYNDCCINARSRNSESQSSLENRMTCMPYGDGPHSGVYVISSCSDDWTGSSEIQQKCEGPDDFSIPTSAAPVTSIEKNVTYRNSYCAECNYETSPLTFFSFVVLCEGLDDLTEYGDVSNFTYNSTLNTWGLHGPAEVGNATIFIGCNMKFDVPDNLKNNVRFCRSNVISTCAPAFKGTSVKQACQNYMAVVLEGSVAYRNAHCAICNNRNISDLVCPIDLVNLNENLFSLKKVITITKEKNKCPSNLFYDHYFDFCIPRGCFPGLKLVKLRCVRP